MNSTETDTNFDPISEADIFLNRQFLIDSFLELNQPHLSNSVENCHELCKFIGLVSVLARHSIKKNKYGIFIELQKRNLIRVEFKDYIMYVYSMDLSGIFYKYPGENELRFLDKKLKKKEV